MRTHTSNRPLGTDPATDHALNEQSRTRDEHEFFDSTTVHVEHTSRGTRWHVKPQFQPKQKLANLGHPFKIYQPTNFASFPTGITFLDGTGAPTVCNIDKTNPTNFASNPPTVNPQTDAWRFWAVRTGAIETRPVYSLGSLEGVETPNSSNFGKLTQVINCDGVGMEESSSTETNSPPLIMAGNPQAGQTSWYDFWIRIQPDPANSFPIPPAVAITANLNNPNAYNGTVADSPGQIFIGVILSMDASGIPSYINQILYSHVTGRYPSGCGNFINSLVGHQKPTSTIMNIRGIWDGANTYTPADLNQQIFYPGDCIIVNQVKNVILMMMDDYPVPWMQGGDTPLFSGSWVQIFST